MTLATVDTTICPECGAPTTLIAWAQPALLIHGGYGATEAHERRICPCGWGLETSVTTETPRENSSSSARTTAELPPTFDRTPEK